MGSAFRVGGEEAPHHFAGIQGLCRLVGFGASVSADGHPLDEDSLQRARDKMKEMDTAIETCNVQVRVFDSESLRKRDAF